MTSLTALIAPILGGLISLAIWQAKKNSQQVQDGLENLHDCVHEVSRKVDDVQLDIAKNYCTRDELKAHIEREEDWHDQHHTEVRELKQEFKEKTDKLTNDVAQIKDMQWQIRMDQLGLDKRIEEE
jgi:uncharacterized coiled-coil DUF342 family protein